MGIWNVCRGFYIVLFPFRSRAIVLTKPNTFMKKASSQRYRSHRAHVGLPSTNSF